MPTLYDFQCAFQKQHIIKYLFGTTSDTPVFQKWKKRGFGKPFTTEEYGRHIKGLPISTNCQSVWRTKSAIRRRLEHQSNMDVMLRVRWLYHTTEAVTAWYDYSDFEKTFFVERERNLHYRQNH